jgi:ribosomal-protein-alanine N-acetyltransferase
VLRRVSRDDIQFVFSASRHPGFCDGMRWSPPATEEELLIPYEKNLSAWEQGIAFTFTITAKDAGVRVGRIAIRRQAAHIWDLGFWTHPDHQRRGYMTEAAAAVLAFGFEALSASQIEAAHAIWNAASRRVLEKIGMSFVRHVPQGFQKDGQWIAEDLFALSAAEWRKRAEPSAGANAASPRRSA